MFLIRFILLLSQLCFLFFPSVIFSNTIFCSVVRSILVPFLASARLKQAWFCPRLIEKVHIFDIFFHSVDFGVVMVLLEYLFQKKQGARIVAPCNLGCFVLFALFLEKGLENINILPFEKRTTGHNYISSNVRQTGSISYFGRTLSFKCCTFSAKASGLNSLR